MNSNEVGTAAKADLEQIWRISGDEPLVWRVWDGVSVIYHPLSGDTQILDVSTAEIVRSIDRLQPSKGDLCAILARFLEVECDVEIEKAVTQIVGKLDDLGIVEPIPG